MTINTARPLHMNADIATHGNTRAAGDNRPSNISMALIKRVHDAVKTGYVIEPFTAKNIVTWMNENDIRKEDGSKYTEGYVSTLLSNSYIKKRNRTNRNSIWLDRQMNIDGVYEYWFVD